ncbi:MAG TPA: hypothetical protein VKX46_21875 [Ktedonobacteraceae bacterium]|nr:hypothetical protein [Ktedonobacteraceae bacterium]
MSEDIAAFYEDEESPIIPSEAKSFSIQFARVISNALSPVTISLPFVLLVALYHAQPAAIPFAGLTLFFLSVGPVVYITVGVSLGKFSDLDVSVRSQRTGPFLFSMASTLIGLSLLLFLHGPKNLETLLLITLVCHCLMMVTTFWWKISMHASSISGAVTMLAMLYGIIILPAYLLVVLVAWSRVVLRRHTLAQVTAGALLSSTITTLMLLWRGV